MSTLPDSVAAPAEGFQFKKFFIAQDRCAMKVGTDGVLLGAWVEAEAAQSILDIGTGTGVIAVMLAQRNELALVHGVEIDDEAAAQAAENMRATPWAERLHVRHHSIQDYARDTEQRYDLIVSNPPFFTGGVLSQSENKTGVRHTVKLPHGDLLIATQTLLTPQGVFAVVLPLLEGLRFVEMARSYRLYCERMTEVRTKAGKPVSRLLLQFTRQIPHSIRKDELIIQQDEANAWTPEYRELTKEFYL
jgi:tRNA1Val (adenine37-N6)-methyltransferase